MRFSYDRKTDSLRIHFVDGAATRTVAVNDDVVVDVDATGRMVGMDIQHASTVVPDFESMRCSGFEPTIEGKRKSTTKRAASAAVSYRTTSPKLQETPKEKFVAASPVHGSAEDIRRRWQAWWDLMGTLRITPEEIAEARAEGRR